MENNFDKQIKALARMLSAFFGLLLVFAGGLFYLKEHPNAFEKNSVPKALPVTQTEEDYDKVENGIHIATGFVDDDHMELVIQNCTNCHSAKLVTQNRMSEAGWKATITWMQETQNLWDLGVNEEKIIAYLAKNYAPNQKGRRQNLSDIEWYELKK